MYAKTHEWAHVAPGAGGAKVATVGISAFAVEALTDLVYLDLPAIGRQVTAGESFGEVESVKAVSDIYAPVSGEVIEVNADLPEHLEWLSEDPYDKGWVARIRLTSEAELKQLSDFATYQRQCEEEQH
ncbi:MAG: glycine cleavage system protein GcvH [Planctomycetia bacterium]|nr:glycine cleavage system protein GcvH [Planctomycetia bacterium]